MLRTIDIVMIGLLVGGAAFTFKVKADSEAAIARVAELERQIEAEREIIEVLKADWSLLTDPSRLAALAERYRAELGLEPLDPAAIVELNEIPMRPPVSVDSTDENETRKAGIADLIPREDIVTGGIPAGQESNQQ